METIQDLIGRFDGTLDGEVALITGAGSGIGRACAAALARAGADVALMGRREAPLDESATLVETAGRRAVVFAGDVTDHSQVDAAAIQFEEMLGPIGIAVANAGVNAWGELDTLPPEALRAALATNVEGVANLARAVVPGMRRRGTGKLLVIASDNGRRAEAEGAGYVASKFGAVGLALSLSQELYGTGVGVHVIEPGCVDTEWYGDDEANVPRDRMLSADDVAYLALFLATLPNAIVLEESLLVPRGLLVDPW
ncbi:MAG TPA: SDR family oxidoreductase [Actinomycetota bacterium]|jgi:NADP-dependent 3-hydroxy acid dehydrogenase YdfG